MLTQRLWYVIIQVVYCHLKHIQMICWTGTKSGSLQTEKMKCLITVRRHKRIYRNEIKMSPWLCVTVQICEIKSQFLWKKHWRTKKLTIPCIESLTCWHNLICIWPWKTGLNPTDIQIYSFGSPSICAFDIWRFMHLFVTCNNTATMINKLIAL